MRGRFFIFFVALVSCLDQVHEHDVDQLGDEDPNVPRGELHRPGQTCTVCHGGKGPGDPEISIGGTVYRTRGTFDAKNALPGATVHVVDAANECRDLVANRAGNFYVFRKDWDPKYPLGVTLYAPDVLPPPCGAPIEVPDGGADAGVKPMITKIGGDAGCARCHQQGGDERHMPAVFLQ